MDRGVGTTLHQARDRRQIELAEVEAATRIRLRYLSAIENEEWDVLPGGVYTRGFIRTYASFLGLDGERLVEDYRASVERWHRTPAEPARGAESPAGGGGGPGRLRLPLAALVVLAVIAVAVLAVVAIPDGGGKGGGPSDSSSPPRAQGVKQKATEAKAPTTAGKPGVSMRLTASAEVWVCLLNAEGKALVDGQILQAGAEEGPFHSGSFTVSFGNGEVEMSIDGREAGIPATSSPVGYAIDTSGRLSELEEAERPTCA
ncbi:MAG TPA: helix-turn-helix transcriptional regulator [Solirubrobacterales bacterium]|nr:helix-turn-helix transcriptional regulator [Solirubrobacterales bacterium]